MKRKGIDFKLARHLTWRHFNPETDTDKCQDYDADYFARSPHSSYAVIVPVNRCKVGPDGYLTRESIEAAECLPFDAWSRTNMVYGAGWRKQTRGAHFWLPFSDPSVTEEERRAWMKQSVTEATYEEWMERGQIRKWFPVYWTSTTYWVENNRVYTATGRTWNDPTVEREAA